MALFLFVDGEICLGLTRPIGYEVNETDGEEDGLKN